MGKSLFEFSKEKKDVPQKTKEEKTQKESLNEEEMKKRIKDYSKLSENDLMSELYKEVGKQKTGGNFDAKKLASQLENVKPMLSQKQSASLEKILKNLK